MTPAFEKWWNGDPIGYHNEEDLARQAFYAGAAPRDAEAERARLALLFISKWNRHPDSAMGCLLVVEDILSSRARTQREGETK